MQYIALTLLYNRDMIPAPDEHGVIHLVEAGYVHIGETIELEGERAEILLGMGAIAPAPDAPAYEVSALAGDDGPELFLPLPPLDTPHE
jgi:hypothetical protein